MDLRVNVQNGNLQRATLAWRLVRFGRAEANLLKGVFRRKELVEVGSGVTWKVIGVPSLGIEVL